MILILKTFLSRLCLEHLKRKGGGEENGLNFSNARSAHEFNNRYILLSINIRHF